MTALVPIVDLVIFAILVCDVLPHNSYSLYNLSIVVVISTALTSVLSSFDKTISLQLNLEMKISEFTDKHGKFFIIMIGIIKYYSQNSQVGK